ncbi:MAG: 2-hydroxyacyl-CoA dehydratase family protein [Desulfobacteraceae bacterium]|nr:2-hydroxyacyl-CoA dehydratase family protein [Desulfobacteraceae bacterium]
MNPEDRFYSACLDPSGYARGLKQRTCGKILGYFCSYAPVELIHAAGLHPFRILGGKGEIRLADAHLQSYCCSLVRSGLEAALNGSLDFLDGAVFPHTCDSIQRLSDIWRLNAGFEHHFDVVLPVKLNTLSARRYMAEVLNGFRKELEQAFQVEITDEALWRAIRDYNVIREKLESLYGLRSFNPSLFDPSAVHRITAAAMFMEPGAFLKDISEYLGNVEPGVLGGTGSGRKRLVLSGGICSHPDIYDLLARAGADVVWDDLCTGTRWFEEKAEEDGRDPIGALADRYMARSVCPAKHADVRARAGELADTVRRHRADGVVFLMLKFCDPHAFDYPYLKRFLDEAGIASLLLETEDHPPAEGQLMTRFETFVDML